MYRYAYQFLNYFPGETLKLIELDFSLKDEVLIEENQRFYEILLVSSLSKELSKENKKISPIGDKIWQSTSSKQTEMVVKYLHKTLNHYQRIQQGAQQNVQHIINAYSTIK